MKKFASWLLIIIFFIQLNAVTAILLNQEKIEGNLLSSCESEIQIAKGDSIYIIKATVIDNYDELKQLKPAAVQLHINEFSTTFYLEKNVLCTVDGKVGIVQIADAITTIDSGEKMLQERESQK
jgi:hypothetical protein